MNLFIQSAGIEIKISEANGKRIKPKPCEVLVVLADFETTEDSLATKVDEAYQISPIDWGRIYNKPPFKI